METKPQATSPGKTSISIDDSDVTVVFQDVPNQVRSHLVGFLDWVRTKKYAELLKSSQSPGKKKQPPTDAS